MLRQQYRELVESIIEQEKKLAPAQKMKLDAETELTKCNGHVEYSEASLKECENRLARIEGQIFPLEAKRC